MISESSNIFTVDNLNFSINDLKNRLEPSKVLMVSPEYFDIIDVKNAHMEGQKGKLDKQLALTQWQNLRNIYQSLVKIGVLEGIEILAGAAGCEDMVFAANQTFPWVGKDGKNVVVVSKMKHHSRQNEVAHFESFFSQRNYHLIHLKKTKLFEGMGDTIPHPGKQLLYGGYGHRTDISAYEEIAELINVPIVPLELVDDRFYHLDTCFVPLSKDSVMLYPEAFSPKGMQVLKKIFSKIYSIPIAEASNNFALNAHVISNKIGNVAILQKGSRETIKILSNENYEVIEVDTSEYMKSGGSVFCMKMMYY